MRKLTSVPKFLVLLLLLLPLVGCGSRTEDSPYQLYFLAGDDVVYGEAIVGEDYYLSEGEYLSVPNLMDALLAGPDDPALDSPFPGGTQLIWATWQSDGVLRINLSEEYGGLTGISLTLADYCILKTLSQIQGVTGVKILVANQENQFRNHQILTLDDLL